MESFESLVALAMQAENLAVSGPTKFKIKMLSNNQNQEVYQTHGYEVDVIGMRQDKLVLASVKSFFGSGGVKGKELVGDNKGYKMLNNLALREKMVAEAASIYGYEIDQVEMRFYAGMFSKGSEQIVRDWCETQIVGGGPIQVFNLIEVMDTVKELAQSSTYIDDAALVAVKAMLIADEFRAKLETEQKRALEQGASKTRTKTQQDKNTNGALQFELTEVARSLPVGTRVHATTGAVVGVVIGYSQQHSDKPYVKIREDETGKVYIRSAATCTVI